ncbi:MAG TPA: ABC transporter permease [Polyangiaceae bacterium]|nr:ABC transporter permease [Polyangiaceae bacterium]
MPSVSHGLQSRVVPPFVTFVLVTALWEVLVRALAVPAFLIPPPSAVLSAFMTDAATLGSSLLTSAQGALIGFGLSFVLGTGAGLAMSLSRTIERGLYPYALFLQTVPIVAVAPLLVLWFGPGLRAVAVSAFIVSVFPVVANTLAGVRSVDARLRDLFRLYGASRFDTLFKLELPFALPSIATGLRVASGLSVIGAIVGEFVAGFSEGRAGLGITILAAYRQLRTDLLFATVMLASLLGLSLFATVNVVSAAVLRRFRAAS